jgi:hypothetical protein
VITARRVTQSWSDRRGMITGYVIFWPGCCRTSTVSWSTTSGTDPVVCGFRHEHAPARRDVL